MIFIKKKFGSLVVLERPGRLMYHLRCLSVSLAIFEMFDLVFDPVDFVECDESGCKGQDMECEVDKEVFVPAMAMLMIFFHNL